MILDCTVAGGPKALVKIIKPWILISMRIFDPNLAASEPYWKPFVWIVHIHNSMNIKEMFCMDKQSNNLTQALLP